MAVRRHPVVLGTVWFRSSLMSNVWTLETSSGTIARFTRIPSRHLSVGWIGDQRIEIRPQGWGTVVLLEEGREMGRIVRRSWLGRRWDLEGTGFACELVSEPLPRRWTLRIGGHPVAGVTGTAWSYNRLTIAADISIPVWAAALVWQVVVRPWELAAEPRTLRPVGVPAA